MNLTTIIIVAILVVSLVVFLIYRNIKDEQKFEEDMNDTHLLMKDENDDIVRNELEESIH